MRSLAVVFPAPEQVELQEPIVPEPEPYEVLCRATASLISTGTETHMLRGVADPGTNWSDFIRFPATPGYSMVARVLAAGSAVDGLRPGDRITCRVGHRQHFTVAADHVDRVPDGVSDDEAAWTTLASVTQLGVRRATLELGESAAVVGLGALGQLVVQYLALMGARRVVAIDPLPARVASALAHGATDGLTLSVDDARAEVAALSSGRMLDVVFDVTGHAATLAPATLLLRRLGRVVLLGDTPTPSRQPLGPRIVADSIAILGIHGSLYPERVTPFNQWTVPEMAGLFFDYLLQGRMRTADLITHHNSPEDAPAVYAALLRDQSQHLGVTFDWT